MFLEELRQDIALAWRTLRKNPSYSLVVVLTLAIGIAANSIIFSWINPYFFRELPFGESERLVQLGQVGNHVLERRCCEERGIRLLDQVLIGRTAHEQR